jgi:hypothetical protein
MVANNKERPNWLSNLSITLYLISTFLFWVSVDSKFTLFIASVVTFFSFSMIYSQLKWRSINNV